MEEVVKREKTILQYKTKCPPFCSQSPFFSEILLMTVRAKICSSETSKIINVSLDSESQYSFIKESLEEELGLEKLGEQKLTKCLFGGGLLGEWIYVINTKIGWSIFGEISLKEGSVSEYISPVFLTMSH
ncbi:hypothetical protein LAZ67_4002776 [Cordylochernes scorpioides]|uniref:Uncharacterized protein n=1 Tax=Cordylochernes scorpioides TaxID=51811 RepID=A0ABY6KE39_9ARAC|nr:hypothetical protein LAZ67_4002776 [Cordylochernes scorpioides]